MSLAILFHLSCAQYVSDINISIIRSLRLFCWIVGVVSVLQAETCNTDTTPTQPHRNSNTHRTKNNTTNVVIQQNSRKLLMIDILMSETYWAHERWNKITSDIKLELSSYLRSGLLTAPSVFTWKPFLKIGKHVKEGNKCLTPHLTNKASKDPTLFSFTSSTLFKYRIFSNLIPTFFTVSEG